MNLFGTMFAPLIRRLVEQLEINPRDLRVEAVIDEEVHTIASVDARQVSDLLWRRAGKRCLRFRFGRISYEVDLGPRVRGRSRSLSAPRQRGFR